jgi:hypothetical protein
MAAKMKTVYFISLFIISQTLYGQVTFNTIPMDSSLVARDIKTNKGTITINGQVNNTNTPYDSLCIKIFRNSVMIDSVYQGLDYSGKTASFSFSYQIPAELKEYMVRVYGIRNAVQTLDTTINALVAGDVYIIEGQSNALALMRDGGSANADKNEFIRAFGNTDSSVSGFLTYLKWGMGEGDGGITEPGHIGQWGMKLARLLVDSIKIPIAIFNGACGGTPISYYERPSNYKTNLYSNYARLYYRSALTGLKNNVRAILWSQGETDAKDGTSTQTYVREFDTLKNSWAQDYPGSEKIYIFQTRNGGMPTYPLLNLQAIKEAQRQVTVAHDSDIEIIPTSTLRQDSGDLHFDYKGGYEEFGNRAYHLIARDIYGILPSREIDAPMITSAYLSDSTTLIVEEKADSLIRHDTELPIQNFEIENTAATIDTIFLKKNKIVFKLSQYPGSGMMVSYIAQPEDSGNWVTNTNDLETVCFYEYPVTDSTVVLTTTQLFSPALISVYPNPFHDYINITLGTTGKYMIEINDITGRKQEEIEFTGNAYKITAEGWAKGLYFLRMYNDQKNLIGVTKILLQ